MRVKFLKEYTPKGGDTYAKGAVVDLDEGVAAEMIEAGLVKEFPRTDAELAEATAKYYPGDEHRSARQKAERAAQVVPLTGDTRSDVEAATGDDDPHAVRANLAQKAEKAEQKETREREAQAEADAKERAKAEAAAKDAAGRAPRG
jgi:hypothetical protein